MKTTVDKVKTYAPEFADNGDDKLQLVVDDTYSDVLADRLDEAHEEYGNRLLACHALFLSQTAQTGGVQTGTMLGATQTMFDWSKDNDPYYQMYKDLVDRYGHSIKKGWARSYD